MMRIKVLKFGGTSLKDDLSRLKVISILNEEIKNNKIVVVVSAIGRYPSPYATDTLLKLIDHLSLKQMDQIASCGELISSHLLCNQCIKEHLNATCLNIYETGILTTDTFGNGNIINVDSNCIYEALKKYDVVIVPGFFGYNQYKQITSLGRGGSDLSAIAISYSLGLKEVTIYSDVEGIYSCDPKKYNQSILYKNVSYKQALLLSHYKVSVLMNKACEFAMKYGIKIHLKSTFNKTGDTIVDITQSHHKFLIVNKDSYILIDKYNDTYYFDKNLSLENAHYLFIE